MDVLLDLVVDCFDTDFIAAIGLVVDFFAAGFFFLITAVLVALEEDGFLGNLYAIFALNCSLDI